LFLRPKHFFKPHAVPFADHVRDQLRKMRGEDFLLLSESQNLPPPV
jgi:hypothetical protein